MASFRTVLCFLPSHLSLINLIISKIENKKSKIKNQKSKIKNRKPKNHQIDQIDHQIDHQIDQLDHQIDHQNDHQIEIEIEIEIDNTPWDPPPMEAEGRPSMMMMIIY